MNLYMLAICCAVGFSHSALQARNINFTIQNNLKHRVYYAPLGARDSSPQRSDLGVGSRTLQGKTARLGCTTNGGIGHEMVDSDQFPRLLFKIDGDSNLYLYEFTAQPYDEIAISIERGPRLVPKGGVPLGNNIQAQDMKRLEYQDLKQSRPTDLKQSRPTELKQSRPTELKQSRPQDLKQSRPTEGDEVYTKTEKSSWWPF